MFPLPWTNATACPEMRMTVSLSALRVCKAVTDCYRPRISQSVASRCRLPGPLKAAFPSTWRQTCFQSSYMAESLSVKKHTSPAWNTRPPKGPESRVPKHQHSRLPKHLDFPSIRASNLCWNPAPYSISSFPSFQSLTLPRLKGVPPNRYLLKISECESF